jgi:hypothetical protein
MRHSRVHRTRTRSGAFPCCLGRVEGAEGVTLIGVLETVTNTGIGAEKAKALYGRKRIARAISEIAVT